MFSGCDVLVHLTFGFELLSSPGLDEVGLCLADVPEQVASDEDTHVEYPHVVTDQHHVWRPYRLL